MGHRVLLRFVALLVTAVLALSAAQAPSPSTANQVERATATKEVDEPRGELVLEGKILVKQVEPRPGEICLVCDQPIGKHDVGYLVNGQRVPLHQGGCDAKFLKDPWHLLAFLQPRGAFLGVVSEGQSLSPAWFLLGIYILTGLIFAALCAHRALQTGQSAVTWFGIGLAINLVGYLWLLTRPRKEVRAPAGIPTGLGKLAATYQPRACPQCGAANHPSASQCSNCGTTLQPTIVSEVEKVRIGRN